MSNSVNAAPIPKSKRSKWNRDKTTGLLVFLPSVIVMLVIGLYPILRVISYSLYDVDVFLNKQVFSGLDNLLKVLAWDDFWSALWNDLVITASSIIIQIIISVSIAVLLNRQFFGRNAVRGVVMFSYLVPIVVAALVWRFMLNDLVGIVNHVINAWNLPIPTTWFGAVSTAKLTVIGIFVWKFFPFMVLVFLAQLQSIDPVLYEAAKVDGSSAWQEFRYITFPSLKPVILIAAMLRTIWQFNDFSIIQLTSGGGPLGSTETPPLLIYDIVFSYWNLGRGAAVSVVMFVILILMSLVYIRLYNRAHQQLT
jgi:multiple sugar transport system permease protein